MPTTPLKTNQDNYDPRWFIWTIVFLVTTGISLVTYIVTSENVDTAGSVTVRTSASRIISN